METADEENIISWIRSHHKDSAVPRRQTAQRLRLRILLHGELRDGERVGGVREGLKPLNLNRDHSILTWLTVLIQNRTFNIDTPLAAEFSRYLRENFCVDTTNYDLIVGYRADDSYFSFAQDFLSGAISYQQLCRAMYLGELGEQIVLISPAAFSAIHYVGCEEALRSDWLHRKTERDRRARTEYLQSDRMRYRRGELYAAAILDEEIGPDDPRLMRVKT